MSKIPHAALGRIALAASVLCSGAAHPIPYFLACKEL